MGDWDGNMDYTPKPPQTRPWKLWGAHSKHDLSMHYVTATTTRDTALAAARKRLERDNGPNSHRLLPLREIRVEGPPEAGRLGGVGPTVARYRWDGTQVVEVPV